jgi:hypothetical protein
MIKEYSEHTVSVSTLAKKYKMNNRLHRTSIAYKNKKKSPE